MNKKGFTLVELLAVIAILAILVIIALPNVLSMFNKAKKDTFASETKDMVRIAQQQYLADFGKWNYYAVEGSVTDDETIQTITCTSTTGPSSVIKLDKTGKQVVKKEDATGNQAVKKEDATEDENIQYEWSTTYCKIDKDAGNLTRFIIEFNKADGQVIKLDSYDGTYSYKYDKSVDEVDFEVKNVQAQNAD